MRLPGNIFPFLLLCWLLLITSFLLECLPQLCAPTPSQELRSAAQPADLQVLLLALLENRSDAGFLSIHRIFWSPQSFKDCILKFYLNDISQFDEPSWMCLKMSCELADIQLISIFLLSVCLNRGVEFMPSDFPSGLRSTLSWRETLPVKSDAKKALSTWLVFMLNHQIHCPI